MVLRAALRRPCRSLCRPSSSSSSSSPSSTTPSSSGAGSTTHFGFEEVRTEDKVNRVGHVFSSVASNYDIMNDLMSGSLHRVWKDEFVGMLGPLPSEDVSNRVLDVAGGTGDIAFRIHDRMCGRTSTGLPRSFRWDRSRRGRKGEGAAAESPKVVPRQSGVVVFDINGDMLDVGRGRAAEKGIPASDVTPLMRGAGAASSTAGAEAGVAAGVAGGIPGSVVGGAGETSEPSSEPSTPAGEGSSAGRSQPPFMAWVEGNAEELPFEDNAFDAYTIAFGIRNVTQIPKALREARRVLRPGGRFLCLEFSQVENPVR